MFFGLDIEKLLILGVVAAFLIGPQRLPAVAQYAARFIVRARKWADEAKQKVREELGDDMDDVQWRSLDPRQYDPRRIIRDALLSAPSPAVEERQAPLASAENSELHAGASDDGGPEPAREQRPSTDDGSTEANAPSSLVGGGAAEGVTP